MSAKNETPSNTVRVTVGLLAAGIAIYTDNFADANHRVILQVLLWTFTVWAMFIVELRKTLIRFRQQVVTAVLVGLHAEMLWMLQGQFPFRNSLVILGYSAIEGLIAMVLYMVAGQLLDPSGPYGSKDSKLKD